MFQWYDIEAGSHVAAPLRLLTAVWTAPNEGKIYEGDDYEQFISVSVHWNPS